MNIASVMDDLAIPLDTITDLRVFPYYAEKITPPAAMVTWPEPIEYDSAMARGADRQTIPIVVVVGRANARSARNSLAKYAAGSGADSVKAVIESHTPTAYHSARVMRAEFGLFVIAGISYLGLTFYVDVIGQGA